MGSHKVRSQLGYEEEDENEVDTGDNSGESSGGESDSDSVTSNESDSGTGGIEEEDSSEPVVKHLKITTAAVTNAVSTTSNNNISKRGPGRPRGFFGVAAEELPASTAVSRPPRNLSRLLVLQPGARWLRVGCASDKTPPRCFAHCLARRRPAPLKTSNGVIDANHTTYSDSGIADIMREAAVLSGRNVTELLALREKARVHNSQLKPDSVSAMQEDACKSESSDANLEDIFVGEEALKYVSDERYHVCWPWRNGQLATHSGVGGSLMALTEDLVELWSRLLVRVTSDLKSCYVLLLVGDLVPRVQLRLLSDVLLARLCVAGIMLVHEPVCAAFGVGLPSTCVIDLGANKVSVSYVEDGVSLSPARLLLSYGSDDVTHFFRQLLIKELSCPHLSDEVCEKIKISGACHLEPHRLHHANEDTALSLRYPLDSIETEERLKLADCGLVASLVLFRPAISDLALRPRSGLPVRRYVPPQDAPLPDDVFDELYAICTARGEQRTIDSIEGNKTSSITTTKLSGSRKHAKVIKTQDAVPLGLDAAVMEALERLEPIVRQRALNSVVLVGGGAVLPGLAEALRKRIASRLGQQMAATQVEVHADFSEASAADVTWRGGQILAENADYLEELWISPKEWALFGSRLLRERCPFVF